MNPTTASVTYLRPAETAKELRKALALAFPGVKFSVRTDTYSGGSSLRVRYSRGPASQKVERIADQFQGRDFDGMTDSTTYRGSSLLCDESGNVREVHYGSSFVFVNRDCDDAAQAVELAIRSRFSENSYVPHVHFYAEAAYRVMNVTDWPATETVGEYAARCADVYFSTGGAL